MLPQNNASLLSQALGLNTRHLCEWCPDVQVHRDVYAPLTALAKAGAEAGFTLQVASGYRSFARQLAIFNAKAEGRRPVLNSDGKPMDVKRLSDRETLFAILRWSALPGASRHHWGCDVDVIDAAAVPAGYRVQLTRDECERGGVFAPFHHWLDDVLSAAECDFFRPYQYDTGGVAPEPWHLSYRPRAHLFAQVLTPERLYEQLLHTDIALKETLLANFDEIYPRFVCISKDNYNDR